MGHVVRMTATGAFGITFVFLVDATNLFWLSQFGDPQLVAAIGFAYAIQFFSVSSGIGLMIAGTAIVSQAIGRGNREEARALAGASVMISAVVQFFVALLLFVFRHDLIALAGAEGETARLAARYLAITVFSLVPMAISMNCSGALRADGFGAKAMYVTFLSGIVLLLIDPVLIIWMGLGLDGAAIGLVVFRFFLLGFGLYYAIHQENLIARPSKAVVRRVARPFAAIAVPTIATQLATPSGNYLLTMVMAPYGDDAVAAWAVVGRLTVLVFGGIFALSGAIGGIFGQNFGAGYYDRLRSTYRDALIFCGIYTLVAWALLATAGSFVAAAFELTDLGTEVLMAFTRFGVGGFVFIGALFVSNAAFNNLGKPGRSTLINWINHGVLSWPLALALAAFFGASGVIYGQTLAGVVAGIVAAAWGWNYVQTLARGAPLDADAMRPYPPPGPVPDRYRIR
ncbi:multidrug transporter MATE [Aliishimia ponticola]|uniref:Multidrug transporter MATE n=2 Tax=Aliishimia ponticola TaxID=2499833 RepID=A0A4S4NMM4_9RHOB|nr:multidrug transporter MATE [Aliishimia ponticola]